MEATLLLLLLLGSAAATYDLSKVTWKDEPGPLFPKSLYNITGTLWHFYDGGHISPWHDVPFQNGEDIHGTPLLNFVCEIPRGTTAKIEIHKSL
eukprot:16326-Prymnesium_polylepis.1